MKDDTSNTVWLCIPKEANERHFGQTLNQILYTIQHTAVPEMSQNVILARGKSCALAYTMVFWLRFSLHMLTFGET